MNRPAGGTPAPGSPKFGRCAARKCILTRPDTHSQPRAAPGLIQSRACGRRAAPPVPSELHAKRFYISGIVQGVGFRFFARRQATLLGVGGYARNLVDGRVEVYAVGGEEQLQSLAAEIARGPIVSSVERVETHDAEVLEQYRDWFSIEPGA